MMRNDSPQRTSVTTVGEGADCADGIGSWFERYQQPVPADAPQAQRESMYDPHGAHT
jgi:hypothetical protein